MYCVVCCASKFLGMLSLPYLILIAIGIWGGGKGGAAAPPSLVRNINKSGNFYLRVGQSSCSCFVSLIFSIFSFHLSHIKTHTKTQEMALKRLYFSKFSWGACPRTPLAHFILKILQVTLKRKSEKKQLPK